MGELRQGEGFAYGSESLTQLGRGVGGHAPTLETLGTKTGGISVDFPGFGACGVGLQYTHAETRDSAVNALQACKDVMLSWEDALAQTSKNYQVGDDHSGGGKEKGDGKDKGDGKEEGGGKEEGPDLS